MTDKLSVIGGVSLLDAEVMESPSGPGAMVNTAETSAYIQGKYAVTDAWSVGGTITYSGKIYGGTYSANRDTGLTIDDWTRLDLMSDYKINSAATVRLNVLNVTDELYYDALYRSGTPFVFVAPGRSAVVTLDYTF